MCTCTYNTLTLIYCILRVPPRRESNRPPASTHTQSRAGDKNYFPNVKRISKIINAVARTERESTLLRREQLSPLHKLSGYTRDDVAGVFGFFDKLVSDAYDSEEHGRGLHVNDKYQNATSILWRKLFF